MPQDTSDDDTFVGLVGWSEGRMQGLWSRASRRIIVVGLSLPIALAAILPAAAQAPEASSSPRPSEAPAVRDASPPVALAFAAMDPEAPLAGPGVLPTDPAAIELVGSLRTAVYGPHTRQAAAAILAASGVAVVDPASLEPVVPVSGEPSTLRFSDWQLHGLALEAWAGNGISGQELDQVAPMPDDLPLASSMVAGWIAAADTPGARVARALMAGQDVTDPGSLVIPSLALALLAADIAADRPAAERTAMLASRYAAEPPMAPLAGSVLLAAGPRTAQGICTGAQRFIDDVIGTVFGALHATPPREGAGRAVVSVWNWLVDRGRDFVRTLADELTAPVINAIRLVAGTVATIAHVVAALVPYSVVVVAVPQAEIAVPPDPGPPAEGAFYVIVSAGDIPEWPDVLADCAMAADVVLPSLKPAGNPIIWGGLAGADGLLIQDEADAVLDERGAGILRFHTVTEPPEVAQGEQRERRVTLEARILRRDVQEQTAKLQDDLFGRVPDIVRPFVSRALTPVIDGLRGRLDRLLEARGRGSLTVIHHAPRPTPSPTATPPAAVWVHRDRPTSPGLMAGRVLELFACQGADGPWSGRMWAGGIQADGQVIVPFRALRVRFTPRAGRGRDRLAGTLPYGPLSIRVRYRLEFRIEGSTMTITGKGSATGPGGVVAVEGLDIERVTLPIEPAPAGRCR